MTTTQLKSKSELKREIRHILNINNVHPTSYEFTEKDGVLHLEAKEPGVRRAITEALEGKVQTSEVEDNPYLIKIEFTPTKQVKLN